MNIFVRPSLIRRIFIALLFASVAIWLTFYSLALIKLTRAESGPYDQLLEFYANIVEKIYETYPSKEERGAALATLNIMIDVKLKKYALDEQFLNYSVWSNDGLLQANTNKAPLVKMDASIKSGFYTADDADLSKFSSQMPLFHHWNFSEKKPAYRVYARAIQQGKYWIQITQSMHSRHDAINASTLNFEGAIKPFLIGFPLFFIPLLIAIFTGLRPLRLFSQELAQRQPGDLQVLSHPYIYSELAPLAFEFNATLTRLHDLLQREREFLADAAHELRTPLALINAQSDTLIHANDLESREDASRRLTQGLNRANRLVNQLLALARMDAKDLPTQCDIDIADSIRECLAANSNEARRLNTELSYDGPDSFLMSSPNDAINSIVSNLVSNAIRYGKRNGRVMVNLSILSDAQLQLQVLDDGPGIESHQQEKMFLRFHRGSEVLASGSGLGLAIVMSAVRLLGADLQVHTGIDQRGLGLTIRWQIPDAKS